MLKELKRMFGFSADHKPDIIGAQVKQATSRNERAGEAARTLLAEVLDEVRSNRGPRK